MISPCGQELPLARAAFSLPRPFFSCRSHAPNAVGALSIAAGLWPSTMRAYVASDLCSTLLSNHEPMSAAAQTCLTDPRVRRILSFSGVGLTPNPAPAHPPQGLQAGPRS